MSNRINYEKVRPDNIKVMFEMEKLLANNTIDKELQELITNRVSQMNG